jgi:hypothetical protein
LFCEGELAFGGEGLGKKRKSFWMNGMFVKRMLSIL